MNQTINAGANNAVSVTLGGILKSLAVAIPMQQIRGTVPSSQNIIVEGFDADHNVIVTDSYVDANSNPVSIGVALTTNTANVFSLGATSLSAPPPTGVKLSYNGGATAGFATAFQVSSAGGATASGAITVLGPTFTEFNAPGTSTPNNLALAPAASHNKDVWFTDFAGNKVGRVTSAGVITEYPAWGTHPNGITGGPAGNADMWVAELTSSDIYWFGTDGASHGHTPTTTPNAGPYGITAGTDGNLWFAEEFAGKIGEITPGGVMVNEYPVPSANPVPLFLTAGPDGNIWFTDGGSGNIGRITPAGAMTLFPLPAGAASTPDGIVAGADGRLWFSERLGNNIGAITTGGVITEYALPTANAQPNGMTAGADGNVWFVESNLNKIARISASGAVVEYAFPTASSLYGIVAGPDNNLWFGEYSANKIGTFSW